MTKRLASPGGDGISVNSITAAVGDLVMMAFVSCWLVVPGRDWNSSIGVCGFTTFLSYGKLCDNILWPYEPFFHIFPHFSTFSHILPNRNPPKVFAAYGSNKLN